MNFTIIDGWLATERRATHGTVTHFNVQEPEIEDVIRQLFADAPEGAGASA